MAFYTQLHFIEVDAPISDQYEHDILLASSHEIEEDEINNIFGELQFVKNKMDDFDEEYATEEDKALYYTFCDAGWHDKIDAALKIVLQSHKGVEIVNTNYYEIEIF